jgi:hypothetical protein
MLLVQYNVYTTLNVVPTQPHLYVLLFILKQLKIVQGSFGSEHHMLFGFSLPLLFLVAYMTLYLL